MCVALYRATRSTDSRNGFKNHYRTVTGANDLLRMISNDLESAEFFDLTPSSASPEAAPNFRQQLGEPVRLLDEPREIPSLEASGGLLLAEA